MATAVENPATLRLERPQGENDFYEVVNNQIVESPPMGAQETGIANWLARLIWLCCGESLPGMVVVEMLFLFRRVPLLERRPDLAFVPYDRWPTRIIPSGQSWEVVPSLAAEVISESNTAVKVLEKIHDYFRDGVLLVWVIYPEQRVIHVYEGIKSIHVLDVNDMLDGGQVLPGLRLPVSKVFELLAPVQG